MTKESRIGYDRREDRTRRNIRIGKRRTSIRLEPEMWDALTEICSQLDKDLNEICTELHTAMADDTPGNLPDGANFTSELRVFILGFYRAAARRNGRPAEVRAG